jgi:hypothetical protein
MQFNVPVEGHALNVCLQTDKALPPTVVWRPLPTAGLPPPASGTKDGARLHIGRRQTGALQGQ